MAIVLTQTLQQKYKSAAGSCRALFFSAPSGFGKTCAARTLAGGKGVQYRCARDPRFALPARTERWNTLILDDFQDLTDEAQQKEVRALLRECPDRQFLLLSRGLLPGWLIPFQTAGVLTVFTWQDLALDPDAIARLLLEHGVTLTDGELTALYAETYGYALAVELLGQRLERGEPFDRATSDAVRRDLFLYYEDSVLRRLDPPPPGVC